MNPGAWLQGGNIQLARQALAALLQDGQAVVSRARISRIETDAVVFDQNMYFTTGILCEPDLAMIGIGMLDYVADGFPDDLQAV